jgi:peptidyl-tRNA hydrolase
VAARLRRELHADVEMSRGRYGQFKVLVDGQTIVDAGALAALGVLPSSRRVVDTVRKHLAPATNESPSR